MKLYDAIYCRKSVRKYKDKEIPEHILEKISKISNEIEGYHEGLEVKVNIVDDYEKIQKVFPGYLGNYGKVKSPYYIIITSENKEGYLENVGYVFEKVILKLTEMGLGSCWIGIPFKKEVIEKIVDIKKNHIPVLLIAFGYCSESVDLYRKSVEEFRRKNINELVEGKIEGIWQKVLQAARLSPSAINSQPWRFVIDKKYLHIYCIMRSNPITKKLYDNLNKIDIGIALSHIDIALKEFDYNRQFKHLEGYNKKGYKYITSIEL